MSPDPNILPSTSRPNRDNSTLDFDPERIWPKIFSGGVFHLDDASEFAVGAGQTTYVNLQFTLGGAIHTVFTDPDSNSYYGENNVLILPLTFDASGRQFWNVAPYYSYWYSSTYIVLPPGTYTIAAIPMYVS